MAKKPAPKKAAKPAKKAAKPVKKAAPAAKKKVAKPAPKKAVAKKTAPKAAPKKAVKKTVAKPTPKKAAPKKAVAKKAAPKAAPKKMTKAAPAKPVKKAVLVKKAAPAKPVKPVAKPAPAKAAPVAAKPAPSPKPVAKAPEKKPAPAAAKPEVKKATPKPEKKTVTKEKEAKKIEKGPSKPLVTQVVAPNRPMAAPVVKKQVSTLESADKVRYSDEELAEFRELINKKLDEARRDYDLLKQTLANTDNNGTDDTSPSFKMIEDGSETLSREETAQLAGRQEKFIKHLEDALLRIRNKTYGICRVTGRLISKERLRLVPHATLSIEAKQQMTNG